MRYSPIAILLTALAIALRAAQPVTIIRTIDTRDLAPQRLDLLRGETLDLRLRLLTYATPIDLSGYHVVLHGQTVGQSATESYQAQGAPGLPGDALSATNGWMHCEIDVDAWWPPDVSTGTWMLAATNSGSRIHRAGGPLTIRGTPAATSRAPAPASILAPIYAAISNLTSSLAPIATSGSYLDLTDTPTGGWRNDSYWSIGSSEMPRSLDGVTTQLVADAAIAYTTSNHVAIDRQMHINVMRGDYPDTVAWSATPAEIATISQVGYLMMHAVGRVHVTASTSDGTKSTAVGMLYALPGTFSQRVVGGAPGSLRADITDSINARATAGKDRLFYWEAENRGTETFIQSTNCWAYPLDLSGVVVSTSGGPPIWHGHLVTPKHILLAKHVLADTPDTIASHPEVAGKVKWFVGRSGVVYKRTVVEIRDVTPDDDGHFTSWRHGDIAVGVLNEALPEPDVTPYPIFSNDITNSIMPYGWAGIPLFWTTQGRRILAVDAYGAPVVDSFGSTYLSIFTPREPSRARFYEAPIAGDSGRPIFAITSNGLVLISHWTHGSAGPFYSAYVDQINAALVPEGEQLRIFDTSGYATFGE